MDGTFLEIHASKSNFKTWFVLSALLGLLCLWLIFQLALGKPFLQGFFICLLFTLYSTALTLKKRTERLIFKDGRLIQYNIFRHQSVDLPSLVKAERYTTIEKYPSPRLRLEDAKGGRLILCPEDFTKKDLEAITNLISPYIFITRVDKNFMDLQFYYDQYWPDVPRSSIGHILRGTFLFVILPSLILTCAVVIWAIVTKQPAFR